VRRLLLLVSAIVLVDTTFFSALSPLLPHFTKEFGLSKTDAGILTAAYAAGGITAALPAGLFASRVGVKPAVLLGLVLMIGTTVAFGLAQSGWVLDTARFGQGFASAFSWNGALAWLIAASPRDRRGELIGVAMGAAVGGALLGPVVGAVAALIGTAPAFSAVAVLGGALAVWAWSTPAYAPGPPQPIRALLQAVREPRVAGGIWLVLLPALLFGAYGVLVPLRFSALGFGAIAIGAAWLLSAGIEAAASPVLGRWSDRRGRLAPVRIGLVTSIGFSLVIPWIGDRWTLFVVVIFAALAYGMFWVPGTALLSDGTEAVGLDTAFGFTLLNFAWAPGHVIGSAFGAAIADASSDTVSYVILAGLCAATLVAIERRPVGALAPRSAQSDVRS